MCLKIIKLAFIYILSLIILLLSTEFVLTYREYYFYKNGHLKAEDRKDYHLSTHLRNRSRHTQYIQNEEFRPVAGIEYEKKAPAILLMGCSFTYGHGLEDNEIFNTLLSEHSKRTVYNLGLPGSGLREILYILRNKEIIKEQIQDPNNLEYVIYTYIGDHQRRNYRNLRPLSPRFRLKNSQLIQYKENKLFNKSLIKYYIDSIIFHFEHPKNSFKITSIYINEINKEIKKQFSYKDGNIQKPAKMVVLIYQNWNNENWDLLDNDIKIISVKDILGGEFIKSNFECYNPEFCTFDYHPSGKLWQTIIPKLSQELDI